MSKDHSENKACSDVFPALLSTTTLPRADSFSNRLLSELLEGPLRTCEFAKITEKPRSYVDSYLRRLRNGGLVEKQGYFWNLNEKGAYYLGRLEKIEDRRYRSRHNNNTTTTQSRHSKPTELKEVPLLPFLHNLSLPDAERRVVEVLLDHYDKTHSKFLYRPTFYDVAELFQVSPDQIRQIMRNLKQDHIAYPFWDRSQEAWKIALYKGFVEMLPLNHAAGKQSQASAQVPIRSDVAGSNPAPASTHDVH